MDFFIMHALNPFVVHAPQIQLQPKPAADKRDVYIIDDSVQINQRLSRRFLW